MDGVLVDFENPAVDRINRALRDNHLPAEMKELADKIKSDLNREYITLADLKSSIDKETQNTIRKLMQELLEDDEEWWANLPWLEEGKKLFKERDFEGSKFLFEKDIVFNPKSENSYLYLAKIFNQKDNDKEEEMNLNNVLLLNPQNDEAIYMLIILKIKQSDYGGAKDLMKTFNLVCKEFCVKKTEIEKIMPPPKSIKKNTLGPQGPKSPIDYAKGRTEEPIPGIGVPRPAANYQRNRGKKDQGLRRRS